MKVNLSVQAELGKWEMRRLRPWLKKRKLTLQEAVDRGIKDRIPSMYVSLAAFLAAKSGVGVNLERR